MHELTFFFSLYFLFYSRFSFFPLQDIKTKLPEKANIGFPVSDGIGRLQVNIFVLSPCQYVALL